MRKQFRIASALAAMAAAVLFTSACETLEDAFNDMNKTETEKDKAQYVLTVHEIVKYPRAQDLELNIPSFSGAPICVNMNYFLHSKNITKVEIVEEKDKPGFYDLDLTLDRRGKLLWTSMSVNFRNVQMAFVIDGVYYRSFAPEQLDSDEDMVVRIKGPFDMGTANGIKKNAEKNYKIYNNKDK